MRTLVPKFQNAGPIKAAQQSNLLQFKQNMFNARQQAIKLNQNFAKKRIQAQQKNQQKMMQNSFNSLAGGTMGMQGAQPASMIAPRPQMQQPMR